MTDDRRKSARFVLGGCVGPHPEHTTMQHVAELQDELTAARQRIRELERQRANTTVMVARRLVAAVDRFTAERWSNIGDRPSSPPAALYMVRNLLADEALQIEGECDLADLHRANAEMVREFAKLEEDDQ